MSITGILIAAACVGIVGIFVGLFLGVAGIKFKVEVDEKEEAVLAALPGNNCGGCGFAGCSGLAAAIAKGEAAVNTWSGRRRGSRQKNRCDHGSRGRGFREKSSVCSLPG